MGVWYVSWEDEEKERYFLKMEVALGCLKMTSNGMSTTAQKSLGGVPKFGTSQVPNLSVKSILQQ